MRKSILFFLLGLSSCVTEYDFNVSNETKGIVIQAFITNQSYTESLAIPSDGHYFKVVLAETSDVNNVRDVKITDASVYLKVNDGTILNYTAMQTEPGSYYLRENSFKAESNKAYQINVDLVSGEHFESTWESMPQMKNEVGAIAFDEVNEEEYIYEGGEPVIKELNGINIKITVPESSITEENFYQWTFNPIWMYTASLPDEVRNPVITCWVRSNLYQKEFVLDNSNSGGFEKQLFRMNTNGNDRLFQYFSTNISQDLLTEGYFNYWKDLDAQKDKGGLFDQPPFGLSTNFVATNSSWTVNGYFGVVNRASVRWTFDPSELSYEIYNNLYDNCLLLNNEPGAKEGQCYYCNEYNSGDSTPISPEWWENR